MLVCWLATYLLAPPLISLVGGALNVGSSIQTERRPLLGRLLGAPRAVLGATLLLSVVAGLGIHLRSGDWQEHDFSKLRRRDSWVSGERYWGQRMDKTLGTYLTPTVILTSRADVTESLEKSVIALRDAGQAGNLVASVRSLSTVLPETRILALEEARRLAKVLTPRMKAELEPRDRERLERALSDEALRPLSAQDLPDVLAAGLREHDGTMDRSVLIFPRLSGGTWDGQALDGYATDLRRVTKEADAEAEVAGALLLSSDISAAMHADGPRATAIALGVVLVVAFLAFRRVSLSIAAVVSLVVGVLLMLGVVAWAGMRLNFSNFVALPITFGIAADYSINMLKRIQVTGSAIEEAAQHTGGAVALCSATTIIGFGSLLVAQNQALFSFGVFATTGELTCLFTAIVALPAMLVWWRRRKSGALASDAVSDPIR
jgi:predicted exporter